MHVIDAGGLTRLGNGLLLDLRAWLNLFEPGEDSDHAITAVKGGALQGAATCVEFAPRRSFLGAEVFNFRRLIATSQSSHIGSSRNAVPSVAARSRFAAAWPLGTTPVPSLERARSGVLLDGFNWLGRHAPLLPRRSLFSEWPG